MQTNNLQTKHAILTYTTLLLIVKDRWLEVSIAEPPRSIHDLCELAEKYRLTHLWVRPSGNGQFTDYDQDVWNLRVHNLDEEISSIHGWRKSSTFSPRFSIAFLGNTKWAWMKNISPKQLLVTIAYLETALGVAIDSSPMSTGWKLLETKNDWVKEVPQVNLIDLHFSSEAAQDLMFTRPLTRQERSKKKLYKFDMSGAYLHAVTSNDSYMGGGNPSHVFHGQDIEEKKVGVWNCTVFAHESNLLLPPVWEEGNQWLAAPVIRLLRSQGYTVDIKEGYVFPQKHLMLQAWGKHLWKARQAFSVASNEYKNDACRELALLAIKQIYTTTIGVSAFGGFEDEKLTNRRRPDIKMQAVARTYEVVYHALLRVYHEHSKAPVMVYTDALYYVGDEEDGRLEVPTLVKREGQLGGFKYVGSIDLTPEVVAILDNDNSVGQKLTELNKIGWTR